MGWLQNRWDRQFAELEATIAEATRQADEQAAKDEALIASWPKPKPPTEAWRTALKLSHDPYGDEGQW